jgi:drug/metabolite transporter (DMT)-like permease
MIAGTIMTLPVVPLGWDQIRSPSAGAWIGAFYLGLLPSALGFVLWAYAVARLPVAACTSLLYLVPPVAVVIAWLWLGEVPIAAEVLGSVVVIAGVVVISQGPRVLDRRRSVESARVLNRT